MHKQSFHHSIFTCHSRSPNHIQVTRLVFNLSTWFSVWRRVQLVVPTQFLALGGDLWVRHYTVLMGRSLTFYVGDPSSFPWSSSHSSAPHSSCMLPCPSNTRCTSVVIPQLISPKIPPQRMYQHASSFERRVGWLSTRMHCTALCPCMPHLKHSLLHMAAVPGLSRTGIVLVTASPMHLLTVHCAICHLYITRPASVSGWWG
jgi:hypothetical protein